MTKLNKAEKFVRNTIANAPLTINTPFELHFYAFRMTVDHLQLESGYADIPDKKMPIEYEEAINKFAPNTNSINHLKSMLPKVNWIRPNK